MKYHAENAVSSFFYYMWNAWSKEECKVVFGGDYLHFWENGTHRLKIPFMVRRNGSIPNYRNAAGRCWWNVPYRFMTARLLGKGLMIRKYMSVVNVVLNRLRYRFGRMPTRKNITAMWRMPVTENGVSSVRAIYIFVPKPNSSKNAGLVAIL